MELEGRIKEVYVYELAQLSNVDLFVCIYISGALNVNPWQAVLAVVLLH